MDPGLSSQTTWKSFERYWYTRDERYYSTSKIEADRENMITILDTTKHDVWKAKVASAYRGKENLDFEQAVNV